eukprot:5320807-Pyramimonas_sp.AAC.1
MAGRFVGAAQDKDTGCVEENLPEFDGDEAVARTGERMIYGWPGQSDDPIPARSVGRFARAF